MPGVVHATIRGPKRLWAETSVAAMGSIVVCGGGVIGLASAIMLARDGHQVTVLEADPADVPATPREAWESRQRKGVAQFRQPHNLFARFRQVRDRELPEMTDRLLAAGCVWREPLANLPPGIADREPRPGDEAFRFVTGRRPAVEYAIAVAAREQPGLVIRRGVQVTGLTGGPSSIPGVPHVTGVRISGGEELHADLVIDAMGRRSRSAELLAALGARAARGGRRQRICVLHPVLHRPGAARPARPAAGSDRHHLGGHHRRR
jgi:2-polyprenyl-6-methoxyphenol hydroxylase-like FAD-dependent oxidoreductase